MTTLLYRGHNYVQHKKPVAQSNCIELTYRREHYNTCRDEAIRAMDNQLAYRGISYSK
ncbi:DUF4278 domain-containing protein [Prochlorococcus sp. MIT 1223]|uniref:DUF4278 domain-containing protein n=1 Tax=Prochlorococcus sp. MIT 1223 TaxID=3096217 RepID=UPI002A754C54|nr:DUF4278 domain-containing protein [Prochlorococcus sp. MIT 1223]